jgi:hypothetical protein
VLRMRGWAAVWAVSVRLAGYEPLLGLRRLAGGAVFVLVVVLVVIGLLDKGLAGLVSEGARHHDAHLAQPVHCDAQDDSCAFVLEECGNLESFELALVYTGDVDALALHHTHKFRVELGHGASLEQHSSDEVDDLAEGLASHDGHSQGDAGQQGGNCHVAVLQFFDLVNAAGEQGEERDGDDNDQNG